MADRIKLVQGDSLPIITLTLRQSDGSPLDVSDPATLVRVYFRAAGTTEVLSELPCTKVNGAQGVVSFGFFDGELDVDPGAYEGEVEVDFDGATQTVYEVLKFQVRAQFA